jgi:hypothetical protein
LSQLESRTCYSKCIVQVGIKRLTPGIAQLNQR